LCLCLPVWAEEGRLSADPLETLRLVKTASGLAVMKTPKGELVRVGVGDRIGPNRAEITEIEPGRMVAVEAFTDKSGRPNRARVVFEVGKRPDRYLDRPERASPPALVPVPLQPAPTPPEKGFGR
jgi:hypothetical protein